MRLLTAVAALGQGTVTLYGTDRMGQRPIQDLIDALGQIGVRVESTNRNGCPPIEVSGGSQYLSALLLIAPCLTDGLDITVTEGPVSRPYVDMTVDVMADFGVAVHREGYRRFQVAGRQTYHAGAHVVEPAGYFWAAAAICQTEIKVKGVVRDSHQGDVRFAELLESMGCDMMTEPDGIAISGGDLRAGEFDMGDMPDMVPTLAVIAAFARGTTIIDNVSHLRIKESDRLRAVADGLQTMKVGVEEGEDRLVIIGGEPQGGLIDSYDDHRIAMSFAVAGLGAEGVCIAGESCVDKSFPQFWETFQQLYG